MSVRMTGGPSGMRNGDYLPPVPSSGRPQPMLKTEGGNLEPNVEFLSSNPRYDHVENYVYKMPESGGLPENTEDVRQQDIVGIEGANPFTSGEGTIFRGTADTDGQNPEGVWVST